MKYRKATQEDLNQRLTEEQRQSIREKKESQPLVDNTAQKKALLRAMGGDTPRISAKDMTLRVNL